MIRQFRTSIWTLGSGSLLIVAAALSRDETLRSRFVGEPQPTAVRTAWITPFETAELGPAHEFDGFNPSHVEILPAPIAEANRDTPIASAAEQRTPAQRAPLFQNASLRHGPHEPGPKIQFGPLSSGNDQRPDEHAAQEPLAAAAPAVVIHKPEESLPADSHRDVAATADLSGIALVARLYRPNAMTVSELERLVRPLLTPGVGTATVSKSDAASEGPADGSAEDGGQNQPQLLLIRDRPQVVRQIDALYSELDAAPERVVIDALIADVTLPDTVPAGSELQQSRFGLIDAEPQAVVKSLRTIGHVSIIATNQLHVVDRQWAELEWTQRTCDSPTSGPATAAVQDSTLRLTTKFRIRPSLLFNGLIRLEVHPQSGRLKPGTHSERSEMTTVAFTTDLVLHAGTTAVIAGSVDERPVDEQGSEVDRPQSPAQLITRPGDSPTIHPQPRVRRETVLLVMPRIVPEN